jgi:hypothetical protein
MTTRAAFAAALVTAVLAVVPARAQVPAPIVPPVPASPGLPPVLPYEDEPSLFVSLLLRSAGLSPDQSRKVHRIMTEHRPRLAATKDQVRAAQDALGERMAAPGALTGKDLEPFVDRLAKAHRAQIDEIVTTATEVRGVLTPEQLARAGKWTARFRALRNEMRDLVGDEGASARP